MSNLDHDLIVKPSLKVWFMYLILFILVLVVVGGAYVFIPELANMEFLWRIVLLCGLVPLAYQYIRHVTTSYLLNSIELIKRSGVFSRKISRIPINRITNYDFSASFWDRLIGIGDVMIDTPGGDGFELVLKSISIDDADRVMKFLASFIAQQKIADAGSNQKFKEAIVEDAEQV